MPYSALSAGFETIVSMVTCHGRGGVFHVRAGVFHARQRVYPCSMTSNPELPRLSLLFASDSGRDSRSVTRPVHASEDAQGIRTRHKHAAAEQRAKISSLIHQFHFSSTCSIQWPLPKLSGVCFVVSGTQSFSVEGYPSCPMCMAENSWIIPILSLTCTV